MQTLLGNEAESVHIDVVFKVVRSSDPCGGAAGVQKKKQAKTENCGNVLLMPPSVKKYDYQRVRARCQSRCLGDVGFCRMWGLCGPQTFFILLHLLILL